MRIKIGKYLLHSDSMNFMISTPGKDKHGKEVLRDTAYYGKIEHLLIGLMQKKLKSDDIRDLAGIGRTIQNLQRDVDKIKNAMMEGK